MFLTGLLIGLLTGIAISIIIIEWRSGILLDYLKQKKNEFLERFNFRK